MGTTRRNFLTVSASVGSSIVFNLALPSLAHSAGTNEKLAHEIASWIVIHNDNSVTVRIPQMELGQGISTALTQVIAEEINLELSLTDWEFYDPLTNYKRKNVYVHTYTGGSFGMKMLFSPMRIAGAQIKEMLMLAAARHWDTDTRGLVIKNHQVINTATDASVGFGELSAIASSIPIPDPSKVKTTTQNNWRYIGKPIPRSDAHDKSTGKAIYGIDLKLPGMKYAAVKQCPVFGGSLVSFNSTAIKSFQGVQKVVAIKAGPSGYTVPSFFYEVIDWQMDDAVAVVADSWWEAQQALDALPIVWDEGANKDVSSTQIEKKISNELMQQGEIIRQEGDVDSALLKSEKTIKSRYYYPFLEHAALEPMNCTALIDNGRVEAWAATQYGDEALRITAYAAGVAPYNAKFNLTLAGGGFGRRLHSDYVSQAVQIAKEMEGVPVKLIWSREESMQRSFYAPVMTTDFTGGLDADGNITAWKSHVCQGRSVYQPYAMSRMVYPVPNVKIEYSTVKTPPPYAWMRGVGHTQALWMYHGFVSELAELAGIDSLTFQLQLLDEKKVSKTAPEYSNLGVASSYEDSVSRVKKFRERLLHVVEKINEGSDLNNLGSFGYAVFDMSYAPGLGSSIIAIAIEIEMSSNHSALKIKNVMASVDCGLAVNPQLVESQIVGGIVFGLSNALYGEITLENGKVQQSNFHDYPILRLKDTPSIEVYIAPSEATLPNGIGEGAVPVVIAALVDAIHTAGGPRIRKLPILKNDISLFT
jgi:isoquinoline 1-oxidoreductase beta subunit